MASNLHFLTKHGVLELEILPHLKVYLPPQPQLPNTRQRHCAAQAGRRSRAEGRRVPGVPAGAGHESAGRKEVHRHRIRIHGRNR